MNGVEPHKVLPLGEFPESVWRRIAAMLPPYAPEPYVDFNQDEPRARMLDALKQVRSEVFPHPSQGAKDGAPMLRYLITPLLDHSVP